MKRASAAAAFLLLVLAAGGQEPGPYARYARGVAALEGGNPKQAKAELAIAAEGIPGQPEILTQTLSGPLRGPTDGRGEVSTVSSP